MGTLTDLGNAGILQTLQSVHIMQSIGRLGSPGGLWVLQRPAQDQPLRVPRRFLMGFDRKSIVPYVLDWKTLQAILGTLRRRKVRASEGRSEGLVLRMTRES
jgi:hypothetical protein